MKNKTIFHTLLANLLILLILLLLGLVSNELGSLDNDIALPIYLPAGFTFYFLFKKNRWNILGIFIGIFLEAFWNLRNLPTSIFAGQFLSSLLISVANTLQPVLMVILIEYGQKKWKKTIHLFNLPVLMMFLFSTFIGSLVSGLLGPVGLILGGYLPGEFYRYSAFSWFISNLAAVFIFTPFTWFISNGGKIVDSKNLQTENQVKKKKWMKSGELLIFGIISLAIQYVILIRIGLPYQSFSFEYLLFLIVIWAIFRFSPAFAAFHIILISISTMIGIYSYSSPFYFGDIAISTLLIQIFLIVLSLTNLVLIALVNERRYHLSLKVLSGFLPICSVCKKIRNDEGDWQILENFMDHHSEVKFTHSYCPNCANELMKP